MSKIDTCNFFCIWVSVCLLRKPVAVFEICDQDELLCTGLGANFRMCRTPSAQVVRPLHHRTGEKLARIFFILFPAHVVCRPCGLRAGATSPPCSARAHLVRCAVVSRMARRENAAHRDCALARPLPPSLLPPTHFLSSRITYDDGVATSIRPPPPPQKVSNNERREKARGEARGRDVDMFHGGRTPDARISQSRVRCQGRREKRATARRR